MAKSAAQYPITFGYNEKYPWGGLHKGDDRAMPIGTPVTVNGKKIGASGNSGYSTGPHLHNSKFVPVFRDWLWGRKTFYDPEDKGSFKVQGRVVHAGKRGRWGRLPNGSWGRVYGNSVVIKKDSSLTNGKRVFYSYDHLNLITVKKGDWIG